LASLHLEDEASTFLLHADLPLARDFLQQRRGAQRLEVEREARLLQPCDLEQVLDERQRLRGSRCPQRTPLVVGEGTEVAVDEHLHRR
jgi:hypothetical protein